MSIGVNSKLTPGAAMAKMACGPTLTVVPEEVRYVDFPLHPLYITKSVPFVKDLKPWGAFNFGFQDCLSQCTHIRPLPIFAFPAQTGTWYWCAPCPLCYSSASLLQR